MPCVRSRRAFGEAETEEDGWLLTLEEEWDGMEGGSVVAGSGLGRGRDGAGVGESKGVGVGRR